MTAYLLDTNHLGEFFKGDPHLAARMHLHADAQFGTCIPAVGELWFMVHKSQRAEENTARLYAILNDLELWPFDFAAAQEFGKIKAEIRRVGRPIPDIDAQIAAVARLHDFTVLSADAHFAAVPGLRVENWLS